jgi:[ribosomal protein S5]-alanine N-acetyltransferase
LIIETDRLILRDFTTDDWKAVFEYQNDPQYLKYNPWISRSEDEVRAFVQSFIDQQLDYPRIKFQFAIVLKEEKKIIGNCGIRRKEPESVEADIGYELNPQYWNKGYATEAANSLLEFGFDELNVHRIWAHCVADNIESVRVFEKIGMKREGLIRENEWFKGKWWNTLLFGILDNEWKKGKNNI